MKQTNLDRGRRTVSRSVASSRALLAGPGRKPCPDSAHSEFCGADEPIPHGIAMMIDILAREAVRVLVADDQTANAMVFGVRYTNRVNPATTL